MIQVTKYSVSLQDDQTIEELMEQLTENITYYVEDNIDISASIIHREGDKEITVKILKLNEHSN